MTPTPDLQAGQRYYAGGHTVEILDTCDSDGEAKLAIDDKQCPIYVPAKVLPFFLESWTLAAPMAPPAEVTGELTVEEVAEMWSTFIAELRDESDDLAELAVRLRDRLKAAPARRVTTEMVYAARDILQAVSDYYGDGQWIGLGSLAALMVRVRAFLKGESPGKSESGDAPQTIGRRPSCQHSANANDDAKRLNEASGMPSPCGNAPSADAATPSRGKARPDGSESTAGTAITNVASGSDASEAERELFVVPHGPLPATGELTVEDVAEAFPVIDFDGTRITLGLAGRREAAERMTPLLNAALAAHTTDDAQPPRDTPTLELLAQDVRSLRQEAAEFGPAIANRVEDHEKRLAALEGKVPQ